MPSQNWEAVINTNFIHGIDFADGLNLQGEFCYAMEITAGNALLAIKNKTVTNKADVKLKATIRKSCAKLEPFLFLRLDNTNHAYVMKIESNLNLYKLNLNDQNAISSATPIVSGTTPITFNTSYRFSFFAYTLLDGSTVFECDILDGTTWKNEIKQVLAPDIASGDIGFGAFYKFSNITDSCKRVFIDEIEISTPIIFI